MLLPYLNKGVIEAGCDEAGRGPLAGPVFAAAVVLPMDYHNEVLNDSKQLSEKVRYQLREEIERDAIAWAVASCSPEEIDRINILHASYLAMHRALDKIMEKSGRGECPAPEYLLIDGNKFDPYYYPVDNPMYMPYSTIVKGDGKYLSIAAASILAKTYRDDYMLKIADEYPQYDWAQNKGYPTVKHRAAIQKYGMTPYHRVTFQVK